MQPSSPPSDPSETHARLASALGSALAPLADFLEDASVVEIMLNADGAIWVERRGDGHGAYRAHIGDEWNCPVVPHGGLVTATTVRAKRTSRG